MFFYNLFECFSLVLIIIALVAISSMAYEYYLKTKEFIEKNKMKSKIITHQMLEILFLVARMPISYRRIQKEVLKKDYVKHLQECSCALDAFYLLIEEKKEYEVSSEALSCYESVLNSVRNRVTTNTGPR